MDDGSMEDRPRLVVGRECTRRQGNHTPVTVFSSRVSVYGEQPPLSDEVKSP
jgi:hypothetical protein